MEKFQRAFIAAFEFNGVIIWQNWVDGFLYRRDAIDLVSCWGRGGGGGLVASWLMNERSWVQLLLHLNVFLKEPASLKCVWCQRTKNKNGGQKNSKKTHALWLKLGFIVNNFKTN